MWISNLTRMSGLPVCAWLAVAALSPAVEAHYWCRLKLDISFQDTAACPASTFEIFYLPDSLYLFTPKCGKLVQDFNGHCDVTNKVTYYAKGYYRKTLPLTESCARTTLGSHPPPEPIAEASCQTTLEPGPTAEAGKDQVSKLFTRDTLDGSASQPFAGRAIRSYHWRERLGQGEKANPGTVVFSDTTVAKPSFIPIVAGDYRFYLAVEDEKGISDWDTVQVHVCQQSEPCQGSGVRRSGPVPVTGAIAILRKSPSQVVYRVPENAAQVSLFNMQGDLIARPVPVGGRAVLDRGTAHRFGGKRPYVVLVQLRDGRDIRSEVFSHP